MKTLYLDIFSGASGDMLIGALLDLGIGLEELEREIAKLKLDGYHLHAARQKRSNIEGIKFDVHCAQSSGHDGHDHAHAEEDEDHEERHHESMMLKNEPHAHAHEHEHSHEHHRVVEHSNHEDHKHADARGFAEIRQLISRSSLSDWVKKRAIAVFHRIAVAEGKIHGYPPDEVHFHEVGAIDSIIDIVGVCIGLELLGKPRVMAAPIVEGHGWINCAHGRFPIPSAATLEILRERSIPLTQCDEPHELLTPTGAALLAEFAESFSPMQGLVAEKIGYGLGTRDHKTRPNVLRAVFGETSISSITSHDWETDTISVLETNLDDTNPEILGYFVERAMSAGALDAFHTPIQMKKNRPGVLLTVLAIPSDSDKFTEMMMRETSALGIRRLTLERRKLRRESTTVKTPYGEVSVKISRLDGRVIQTAPEFESCRAIALSANIPLKEIYEAAQMQVRKAKQFSQTNP